VTLPPRPPRAGLAPTTFVALVASLAPAPAPGAPREVPSAPEAIEALARRTVVETLAARGGRPPALDPILVEVARQNSAAIAESPGRPEEEARAYLRFLLERAGVKEVSPLAMGRVLSRDEELGRAIDGFLERRAQDPGLTHFGVGAASALGKTAVTLVLVLRRVALDPVRVEAGAPLVVRGRLLSGRTPRVLVTLPSGAVLSRSPTLRGDAFAASFPPPATGVHRVEVMVEGPHGPELAALFPLHVGVDPPHRMTVRLYPRDAARAPEVEARLVELIAATRRERGLPVLLPSSALATAARLHSRDMRDAGFFGHTSPTRGDLSARLSRMGLVYRRAAEDLALATSPGLAHEMLLESPAHRAALLDPSLTHIGVGVTEAEGEDEGGGRYFMTICLARIVEGRPAQGR
jgi:uncharacterized protein YkwD